MRADINYPANFMDSIRKAVQKQRGVGPHVLCKLADNSGALAVVPMVGCGACNAFIYELSGEFRCAIEIPRDFRHGMGFTDAYYVNHELSAVFVTAGRDFVFVVDPCTGNVLRTYETR